MKRIAIIIVNWNSGNLLNNCVKSVLNSCINGFVYHIYIVDNNSSDNSAENIPANEGISVIKNKTNIGFGAACNLVFNKTNPDFYLLLNPDTEVNEDTLQMSFEYMETIQELAVLGVKHIDEQGKTAKSCSRFPKARYYFYDSVGLSKLFPGKFKHATLMTNWDHENSDFVDQVMGAFMMIKSECIEVSGGMDMDYFVYYEDMDLCFRIKKEGGKVFYNSDICIYHKGCGTTDSVKAERLFYSLKSRLIFSAKHFKKINYFWVVTITFVPEFFSRLAIKIIKMDFLGVLSVIKAYRLLLRSFYFNK